MKRIMISGSPADLPQAPIAINWEYLNLAEPGKRYSPFTSTLTLPYTPANKKIMGYGDVIGGNPAAVRAIQDVDLWIGALRFIREGTFKVLNAGKDGYQGTVTGRNRFIEDIESYTLEEIIADCAETFTYTDYADAIESLRAGIDAGINPGFILPRTLEGSIASSIWTIYSGANGHTHEVWLSAAAILDQMIAEGVLTLQVYEAGVFVALADSDLYTELQKLYTPCWNWVLYDNTSSWTIELASGQRLLNGQVVDRADFKNFGGKTSWEFLKAVAQLFCAAIWQDRTDIRLIPLNALTTTGAVDLSGKAKVERKYFAIPGHGSLNHISYAGAEDIGKLTVTSPVKPEEEKNLLTFDISLPGQLYVGQYSKNFFNTAEGREGAILLYDSGDPDYTTITHGTDTATDVLLKVLTYFDFSTWWTTYRLLAAKGIAFDAEIYLDTYSLMRLRPWLLVRINELGGLFYLNKITGFDPDSGKMAKCQVVKWATGLYSISGETIVFTYEGQTATITVTANIAWTVTAGAGVSLNKSSGTGDDTVIVTAEYYAGIEAIITFNFAGNELAGTADMAEMTLDSIDAIGTQITGDPFSPAPTFTATSIYSQGTRRVFWAIYNGATMVRSGYEDFVMLLGTNDYSFTGLTVTELPDTDFTFRIGYKAGTYPIQSANYAVTL
jgi:hypothetical protein